MQAVVHKLCTRLPDIVPLMTVGTPTPHQETPATRWVDCIVREKANLGHSAPAGVGSLQRISSLIKLPLSRHLVLLSARMLFLIRTLVVTDGLQLQRFCYVIWRKEFSANDPTIAFDEGFESGL